MLNGIIFSDNCILVHWTCSVTYIWYLFYEQLNYSTISHETKQKTRWQYIIQLILSIYGFCICQFSYLLKFIGNLKSVFVVLLQFVHGHACACTEQWKIWDTKQAHCQLMSNKATLFLLISALTLNKCAFCGLSSALFFTFLCLLFVILLFKMTPSIVLKC